MRRVLPATRSGMAHEAGGEGGAVRAGRGAAGVQSRRRFRRKRRGARAGRVHAGLGAPVQHEPALGEDRRGEAAAAPARLHEGGLLGVLPRLRRRPLVFVRARRREAGRLGARAATRVEFVVAPRAVERELHLRALPAGAQGPAAGQVVAARHARRPHSARRLRPAMAARERRRLDSRDRGRPGLVRPAPRLRRLGRSTHPRRDPRRPPPARSPRRRRPASLHRRRHSALRESTDRPRSPLVERGQRRVARRAAHARQRRLHPRLLGIHLLHPRRRLVRQACRLRPHRHRARVLQLHALQALSLARRRHLPQRPPRPRLQVRPAHARLLRRPSRQAILLPRSHRRTRLQHRRQPSPPRRQLELHRLQAAPATPLRRVGSQTTRAPSQANAQLLRFSLRAPFGRLNLAAV
mmetsp:Transcript_11359/g.36016  ORF Transcript_11359/g.36016 Transcript_11359/m.36016 type:complete len:409 (+) Transcript_11359:336-1562(+)